VPITWKLVLLAVMFGLAGLGQAKMQSLFFYINKESKSLGNIVQGCGEYPECAIVLFIACTSLNINFQIAPSF